MVDDVEHLGPGAVVLRQREHARHSRRGARGRLRRPRGGSGRSTGTRRRRRRPPSPALSRSTSSHWSRFVSWNSSTRIERKRQRARSRPSRSAAGGRAPGAGDPRSRGRTRAPCPPVRRVEGRRAAPTRRSRSRAAISSRAACSTASQRLARGREALALLSSDPQVGQVEEVLRPKGAGSSSSSASSTCARPEKRFPRSRAA